MSENLETLLRRIRDGLSTSDEVERARGLVAQDARLPEELRDIALGVDEDLRADAAGLLSVLGADDLGGLLAEAVRAEADHGPMLEVDDGWEAIAEVLRDGIRAEAGGCDVSESVLRRLAVAGWAYGPVLAEAVRSEAGEVDIASSVLAELTLDERLPLVSALHAEAGTVDVANAVLAELALDAALPIAEAVRAEAGTVDVVASVLAEIGAVRAASVPVPANDNRGWSLGTLALAAAALVSVVVGALSLPGGGMEPLDPMLFAHAGEVVIEDLSYGVDVQVVQIEGEQGAVILWIDEDA